MSKITFIMPYFGTWPSWINYFMLSCSTNTDIEWLFYTDCGTPNFKPKNVTINHTSLEKYIAHVNKRLGISLSTIAPYKICDLRPAFGHIHYDDLSISEFFAYGDIDVIYGNIRAIYTDNLLNDFDIISTHSERISGHFAVFRNVAPIRNAYESIVGYHDMIQASEHYSLDEFGLYQYFKANARCLFFERYSTPGRPWRDGSLKHPRDWLWKNGRLTNGQDGPEGSLYLHFMTWQGRRWEAHMQDQGLAESGAWLRDESRVSQSWRKAARHGFTVSPEGIGVNRRANLNNSYGQLEIWLRRLFK